jgi:hypothetical protein
MLPKPMVEAILEIQVVWTPGVRLAGRPAGTTRKASRMEHPSSAGWRAEGGGTNPRSPGLHRLSSPCRHTSRTTIS